MGANQNGNQPSPRNLTWRLLVLFLILAGVIVSLGYLYYDRQREDLVQRVFQELAAVADLKVGQIVHWAKERRGDAEVIMRRPFFVSRLHEYLKTGGMSKHLGVEIIGDLEVIRQQYGYREILVLDGALRPVLSLAGFKGSVCEPILSAARRALREGKAVFTDLHAGEAGGEIHIGIAAPLYLGTGRKTRAVGVCVLLTDPHDFLYPLIQSWPTPSATAESLLVAPGDREGVFLNELRHRKGTALRLRFPVDEESLPAAMAVRGVTGNVMGRDYRGEEVFAVIREVPGFPWRLVAKIDREEVFRDVRARAGLLTAVVVVLILAVGVALGLFQSRQQREFFRRQYEGELERRALTRHFEYLTKYANDVILMMDEQWRIVEANERVRDFYDYSPADLVGQRVTVLRPPETIPGMTEQAARIEKEGGVIYETTHLRRDGTTFPVEVSARVITVEGRRFFQAIVRDITERRRVEEALRESETRFRLLFEHMGDAAAVYEAVDDGEDFVFVDFNRAAERIEKIDRRELLGKRVTEVFPGVREFGLFAVLQRVWRTGVPEDHEDSFYRDERIAGWRRNRVYKLSSGEVVAVYEDVTARKEAEIELCRLNEELEERVRRRTEELEAANRELEAFSYSVSHDLRAPLRTIDGFAEAFLEDYGPTLDDEGRSLLERIQGGAKHLGRLIDDLLRLSRVSRAELTHETVDLSGLVKAIAGQLREDDPSREVEFLVADGIKVRGDRHLLGIAVTNLLQNAWKFTALRAAARIEFGAIGGEGERVLFVRDNGVGFDPAYKDKLFNAFVRLHRAEEFPGTGIGLATVKRIVTRHGGRVWAEGEKDRGAAFYFTLPS
ncbi:MAG TPA: PAS domain S-box protein [Syntrophales bacterium]|nr:PAS domain S-box protein [Syntrophales bacterium]HRS88042.1 PAS domain S-box protein [Syntrophales bacterium]HRV42014.1 PAS domain S-box protein [Syntrophales bacterium]